MKKYERIPIVRKEWGTIYGREINNMRKLGRFEVISDVFGHDGNIYHTFAEAESKLDHYQILFDRKQTA